MAMVRVIYCLERKEPKSEVDSLEAERLVRLKTNWRTIGHMEHASNIFGRDADQEYFYTFQQYNNKG